MNYENAGCLLIPILWLERGSHFFFQVDEMITASVPYYYDLKGRVTKQVRTNLLGGADVTTGYADDKNSHLAKDLNKDQCFYFLTSSFC